MLFCLKWLNIQALNMEVLNQKQLKFCTNNLNLRMRLFKITDMKIKANNQEEYINEIPEERKEAFQKLRDIVLDNIPEGFEECMSYGMIGYVVPHSLYSKGYHCDAKLPLPFINIASQKNFVAFYHMGLYANQELKDWFLSEYSKSCQLKLDMGKSCIRFKKMDQIPFDLIGQLVAKISALEWINLYESKIKR